MVCATCGSSHAVDAACAPPPSPGPVRLPTQVMDPANISAIPSSEDAPDPLIGATVGTFRLVRKLGEGGMGAVYLGEQTLIGSRVAVKFLHEYLASNTSLVQRFYAEARAVNLIGHQNIVNIFDMNVLPPRRYYLVMEYLDGEPLATYAREAMSPEEAVAILAQVCDALQAAHERGVVHRDLKPENLFILKRKGGTPFVKVLDFGIAKLFATELGTERTAAGVIVGTPEYMAPEQGTGETIDGRADLYALGVIAYRMLTGRLPFSGGGLSGLLLAHRQQAATPPDQLNPKIPKALSLVILKALAKRREDRQPNAAVLRAELEAALDLRTAAEPARAPQGRPAWMGQVNVTPDPEKPPPPVSAGTDAGPAMISEPPPQVAEAVAELKEKRQFQGSLLLGQEPARPVTCMDLSRGGLYIVESGPLPKPYARVRVALQHPPAATCEADVVRVVHTEQAKAWCMARGYAVQFVSPPAPFREQVAALLAGRGLESRARAAPSFEDDPGAEKVLRTYLSRPASDPYALLKVSPDAEFSEINQRGREAKRELEALKEEPLSAPQADRLERALKTLATGLDRLSSPRRRAAHDAALGNFRGVARCLSAGLTVTELEQERKAFLQGHPGAESKAHVASVAAKAWESKGETTQALQEYERALGLDPLNISIHQRYWALKRKAF